MTPLQHAFRNDFRLGVALGGRFPLDHRPEEVALVAREFNVYTPENCLKPSEVHPAEDRWSFELGDQAIAEVERLGLAVVGHTLVWHQQCPAWFFRDGDRPAPRQLVLERMRAHIAALVGRYGRRITGWDVVNEAIDDGPGFIRPSAWTEHVGPDYVEQAFRAAAVVGDGIELYYNDYNIEQPAKRAKTVRLLRQLLDAGCRIDAVGIQGHWLLDQVPYADIEIAIQEFSALGLQVMITELDLDPLPRGAGADTSRSESAHPDAMGWPVAPTAVLARQAEQYGELFRLFRRHRDAISRVTFWNLHDGRSWLNDWPVKGRTNHAQVFDRQCQAKPAVAAILAAAGLATEVAGL